MRLDVAPGLLLVTLSQRNLQALSSKLHQPGSQRTLTSRNAYAAGQPVIGSLLAVHAEPDIEHYREREPGAISAETEALMQLLDQLGEQL